MGEVLYVVCYVGFVAVALGVVVLVPVAAYRRVRYGRDDWRTTLLGAPHHDGEVAAAEPPGDDTPPAARPWLYRGIPIPIPRVLRRGPRSTIDAPAGRDKTARPNSGS